MRQRNNNTRGYTSTVGGTLVQSGVRNAMCHVCWLSVRTYVRTYVVHIRDVCTRVLGEDLGSFEGHIYRHVGGVGIQLNSILYVWVGSPFS